MNFIQRGPTKDRKGRPERTTGKDDRKGRPERTTTGKDDRKGRPERIGKDLEGRGSLIPPPPPPPPPLPNPKPPCQIPRTRIF